jgi:hypothetical protein
MRIAKNSIFDANTPLATAFDENTLWVSRGDTKKVARRVVKRRARWALLCALLHRARRPSQGVQAGSEPRANVLLSLSLGLSKGRGVAL